MRITFVLGRCILSRANFGLLVLLALAVAGCGGLPVAGPHTNDILSDHKDYLLVDVTPQVCDVLARGANGSLAEAFKAEEPPPSYAVRPGDTLSVSIWEAGGSGLFATTPMPTGAPVPRGTTLPPLTVAADGTIAVPFAGRVLVAGLSPADAEHKIATALKGKADDPQVLIAIAQSPANSISVVGEVGKGSRVTLDVGGTRLLDAVAEAGGVRIPANEAELRLTRNGRTRSIPYDQLLRAPAENIFLRPGDVLTVLRTPRTFTAFGAFGRNYQIPFETDVVTAEEALAKAGGLNDQRADPAGLFVFRYEPPEIASQLGATSPQAQGMVPVVFHLDLSQAQSYFLARRFVIEDKDIVYAANAELNEVQKFLNLLGSVLSPAATGATVGTAIR